MRARIPDATYVLLLEPYSYGLRGKLAYLVRLVRGMYHLQTAGLFVVDNAYLPIHVAPHRRGDDGRPGLARGRRAQAVRASTRRRPLAEPERTFLHRYYDAVVVAGEWHAGAVRGRAPDAGRAGPARSARRGPTSSSTRRRWPAARERLVAAHPGARRPDGRPLRADVPRSRASASARRPGSTPSGSARRCRPITRSSSRRTRTSTRRRPRRDGYDVVADPAAEINDLLAARRHPHHRLLVVDLRVRAPPPADRPARPATSPTTRRDPGLYLDYRTEMIGTQVVDTDGVIEAIAGGTFDLSGYDAFIERQLGLADGRRERAVRRAASSRRARARGEVIPFRRDVRHE